MALTTSRCTAGAPTLCKKRVVAAPSTVRAVSNRRAAPVAALAGSQGVPPTKAEPTAQPVAQAAALDNGPVSVNAGRRGMLLGGMSLLSCPCCIAKASEWSYGDVSGPTAWSGVCASGALQSPVDIPLGGTKAEGAGTEGVVDDEFAAFQHGALGKPVFKYGRKEKVRVLNTGHGTPQLNFEPGNVVELGGRRLQLLQCHFHTPSEHALGGKRYAMEVHLVHKDLDTGSLAVLGVMLDPRSIAAANPLLQLALDGAPKEHGAEVPATRTVNPLQLLPSSKKQTYVHYHGSLTTPPCTEGVDWVVFTQPIPITYKQVVEFEKFVGSGDTYARNARPLQALNDRELEVELA